MIGLYLLKLVFIVETTVGVFEPWPGNSNSINKIYKEKKNVWQKIESDDTSGCVCWEFPEKSTLCFGRHTCQTFPKDVNITTKNFLLKQSRMTKFEPSFLVNLRHLQHLGIEECEYLTTILPGSFYNMTNLKILSISYNVNLRYLETGSLDGLVNLRTLTLIRNDFTTLANVIPALAKLASLEKLELNLNSFVKIANNDFEMMRSSPLKELSLTWCRIENIHHQAFNFLTNLSILRLDNNGLNESIVKVIDEMSSKIPLKHLSLNSNHLSGNSLKNLIKAISKTSITELHLAENKLEVISSQCFSNMVNLEVLDLREVQALNITYDAFAGLTNLKKLLLSGNRLTFIPKGILLENLTHLDLRQNSDVKSFLLFGKEFVKMKKLIELDLSYNVFHSLEENNFEGLTNLKILKLKNATVQRIKKRAFATLSNLTTLDLEDNNFVVYPLDPGSFEGLLNLKKLLLGGCHIKHINKTFNPFESLKNLEYLGLERNELLSLEGLDVLPKLKMLNLSYNKIQPWIEKVFHKNVYLEHIDLDHNKLVHLTGAMMSEFVNLTELRLSGNSLVCDCDLSRYNQTIFRLIQNQTVQCAFPVSTSNLTIIKFLRESQCGNSNMMWILVGLSFLLFAAASFSYRFNSHLRYWLFVTRLQLNKKNKIQSTPTGYPHTNFLYHAFVSYCNEDENFVVQLIKMLENYPPYLKLCIYVRDFEAGTTIIDNVLDKIAKSRKTLLIVSESYVKSYWCRWESQIAEHHRAEQQVDDSLIVIKLGSVKKTQLTSTLRYLLETRIYLEWSNDESEQQIFWTKLRAILTPPVLQNTHI